MVDKLPSGRGVVDQPAVLVALRVVPATDGDSDLDAVLLQRRHLQVELCTKGSSNSSVGPMEKAQPPSTNSTKLGPSFQL